MEESFAAVGKGLSRATLAKIAGHTHVIDALSAPLVAQQATSAARRFLLKAKALIETCGASGVKCESSGVAHENETWLDLASSLDECPGGSLVRAFVQPLISDGRDVWSCGMHLLGRPDVIAQLEQLPKRLQTLEAFHELQTTFATYLLDECSGSRHFASGHTFRSDSKSPRVQVTFELCRGYDEDDFLFNSFGRYRFTAV